MTAQQNLDKEQPTKRKLPPFRPDALAFEDIRVVRHCLWVPAEFAPEDLLDSGVYISLAQRLQANAIITAIWEDKSAIATLFVMEASPIWTSVVMLDYKRLPGIVNFDNEEVLTNYEIFYSQSQSWCARRLSDSVLIIQGEHSKSACQDALMAHPAFSMSD